MKRAFLAPALALAALASGSAAQAQQAAAAACVQPGDLRDAVIYAMPIAYDASLQACTRQFRPDGFMRTKGSAFAQRFRARQDAAWPGTFRLLKVFMDRRTKEAAEKGSSMEAMLELMPESALRPFGDAVLAQMIAQEIKPDTCPKIERAARLIEPLPPENIAGLVAFIAQEADLKEPSICPPPPLAPARTAPQTKAPAK